eukprot:8029673-Pyramimonas_sp.AAC.1
MEKHLRDGAMDELGSNMVKLLGRFWEASKKREAVSDKISDCATYQELLQVMKKAGIDSDTIAHILMEMSESRSAWLREDVACLLYTSDAADDTPCVDL